METSHPPIPFDPQGLVALICLSSLLPEDMRGTDTPALDGHMDHLPVVDAQRHPG